MDTSTMEMDYETDLQTKHRQPCCSTSGCNSQIFCSYVISILSSILIAGGFYLSILKWDHLWLILPVVGSILIFIGSCMYYAGQMDLKRKSKDHHNSSLNRRRRRNKDRGHGGDNLISSALSDSRSLSQLSINMIPQYFANSNLTGPAGSTSMPYSQILRVNGQSFLILPLTGESTLNSGDNAVSLQNFMVKMPSTIDQQSKPERGEVSKKSDDLSQQGKNSLSEGPTSSSFENNLTSSASGPNTTSIATNFDRENDSRVNRESSNHHLASTYFCIPGTSRSSNSCQLGARSSGAFHREEHEQNGTNGINHPSSSQPVATVSSSSSTASSPRRPLLRRDTFSKSKPIISTTTRTSNAENQLVLVNGQPAAINAVQNSSNSTGSSVTNSLQLRSTRDNPGCSNHFSEQPLPSSSSSNHNATPIAVISPSMINTAFNESQRNPDETFLAMCSGAEGDNFDENLIDPGTATPPPSYEEVLSIDVTGLDCRNSLNFDTL